MIGSHAKWVGATLAIMLLAGSVAARTQAIDDAIDEIVAATDEGAYDRAEILAGETVTLAESGGDPVDLGNALRAHARVLTLLHRYDEAEPLLARALEVLEPLGDSPDLGHTLHRMSLIFRYRAEYGISLGWLGRAEQVFQRLEYKDGLAGVYNSYGVLYDEFGQLELSLDWHRRSLALGRELGDDDIIADSLYAIGEMHSILEEHDEALAFFRDALEMDQAAGIVRDIAYSHNKVGMCHVALGDFELARTHLNRAYELFAQIKTDRDAQWARSNLGRLALTEGKVAEARAILEPVLELSRQKDWPSMISRTEMKLADVEYASKRYDRALAYLDRALEASLARETMRDVIFIYKNRAKVLRAAGRHSEAFDAIDKSYELEQELFNSLRTTVIAAHQSEAEFERQAHALRLAEQEKELAALELERSESRRLVGLAALAGLFIIAFLIYGRLSAVRQSQRLSAEVDQKTRELRERNEELEHAYDAVDQASVTDPLTGLANRRYLERHIDADVAQATRCHRMALQGEPLENADLVFFLVDLDHFKAINDREGHAAGDRVLVQFSRLLGQHFRKADIVARWGGEEFLVVARFTERARAAEVAERLRASVEAYAFQIGEGKSLRLTCSTGFAAFPLVPSCPEAVSWQEVVELADQALYSVKQGPRNGWAGFFSPGPVEPTRPFAEWVPKALLSGELRSMRSFDEVGAT
ncbi:hypothetical protein ABI59_17785 [Acidobacteria bacterium Mor1]|nr:hypothetical protein ABI59_17785 [Acidobacteria bacterium Mor1]